MRQFLLMALALAGGAGQARAEFLRTFEMTTIASGSLGGVTFNNAELQLKSIADTDSVQKGNALGTDFYFVTNKELTITVAGIGTATFTDVTRTTTFPFNQAGFQDVSVEFVLLTFNPVFAPYDLRSDIGPFSGRSFSSAGRIYPTTLGSLIFSAAVGNSSFQSPAIASTPEPSSFALACLGGLGLTGVIRWRRKTVL